jgi:hypothetical protein
MWFEGDYCWTASMHVDVPLASPASESCAVSGRVGILVDDARI